MRYKKTTLILAAIAMIAATAPTASAIEPDQRVDLKVLLITDGQPRPSFDAWETSLQREGVPYDVFNGSADTLEIADLEAGDAHARYQAVVCSTECSHALDTTEIPILDAFQTKYGIRRISGYVFPNALYGMSEATASQPDADMSDNPAALTAAGLGVFPYLNGPIDFGKDGFGWLQAPSTDPNLTTLISGPDFGGTPSTLMGVYDRGGFEDLFLTFDSNAFQIQTHLLHRGLIDWVTSGTYLGYGRNYFTVHIDDVFLTNDRWDTENNCTPGDLDDESCNGVEANTPIRMTTTDVIRALQWQTATGLVLDLVYNGAGSVEAGAADPLTVALIENKNAFRWINHTYTHQNLDEVDKDTIKFEILENLTWANSVGLLGNLNVTELVTGEHSGLRDPSLGFAGNPEMPAALTETGILWVASDNSRTPDQESVGTALTAPRYPANIFYNTATRVEQLDEYNWIYVDASHPDGNCVDTTVTTCLDAPLTWEQYVDVEATIMLPHILTNDARPHFSHQSNLAEDGVLYTVVDEVLARYHEYFNTPVVQPTFAEAGQIIQRAAVWAANQSLITAYLLNGSLVIENPTSSPINVPVTGDGGEAYGSTTSEWRMIAPSTVTPAPTVAVSGPGTSVVGESATFTVDTTGGSAQYTVTPSCDTGTLDSATFDVATGDGSFQCTFAAVGSATVSAMVATSDGNGTGTWTVTVNRNRGDGGGNLGGGQDRPEVLGLVNTFIDDDGNFHEPNIEKIAALGITIGCDPLVGNLYCPDRTVTRAEMAAFIIRALGETGNVGAHRGYFPDVPASVWYSGVVERLFELGITIGNSDGTYAPNALMTRAEMAAFLDRAFVTQAQQFVPVVFADVPAGAWYAESLQQIYAADITTGCAVGPLRYCPDDPVRRDAMASFIARALGLGN